jgi:hypothetical protein
MNLAMLSGLRLRVRIGACDEADGALIDFQFLVIEFGHAVGIKIKIKIKIWSMRRRLGARCRSTPVTHVPRFMA